MADETSEPLIDLSSSLDDLFAFERQVTDLSEVGVPQAADAMADAFEQAGLRIEQALSRAARTGELNFESMITSVLADLARIGVGAVMDHAIGSIGSAISGAPPVSINIAVPEGAGADSILSAQGQIAAALSQAVMSGARWS
ncbi:MAG: hypothetical protein CMK06_03010 [Ponticaulis sp.]|nr:hypothetical protein [Ponticaulis sp.]|tara:strand:- start:9846 stop:10271 length:426 start_codon:yes stop_codon:yes gene_type:complete